METLPLVRHSDVLILLGRSDGYVLLSGLFVGFFFFIFFPPLNESGLLMKSFHLSCLDRLLPRLVNPGVGNFFSCVMHAEVYTVISAISNAHNNSTLVSAVSEFQTVSLLMVFQGSGCRLFVIQMPARARYVCHQCEFQVLER